eukprot:2697194-Pleurochrysis_carterae.AAC.1
MEVETRAAQRVRRGPPIRGEGGSARRFATARNVRRSDPGSGKEWEGAADPISDGEGRTGRERERR